MISFLTLSSISAFYIRNLAYLQLGYISRHLLKRGQPRELCFGQRSKDLEASVSNVQTEKASGSRIRDHNQSGVLFADHVDLLFLLLKVSGGVYLSLNFVRLVFVLPADRADLE